MFLSPVFQPGRWSEHLLILHLPVLVVGSRAGSSLLHTRQFSQRRRQSLHSTNIPVGPAEPGPDAMSLDWIVKSIRQLSKIMHTEYVATIF